jgi:hypothetical protein
MGPPSVNVDFPVRREFLRADPTVTVARATLGLTVYLANGVGWAREGAVAALDLFARHAGRERLRWYSRSTDDLWVPVLDETLPRIASVLPLQEHQHRARHLLQLRVVDDTSAPSAAFVYRELDEDRAPCAGYLQCVLPFDHPLDDFLAMSLALLQLGLWWNATAGYLATWSVAEKPSSFATLRRWCRRYRGLDVQDPDAMMALAPRGLPGVNWLTALGKPFMARNKLDPAVALAPPWSDDVALAMLPHGVIVRAGDVPTLGDLNTLSHPDVYAEVARRLDPWMTAAPPPFPWWTDEDETLRWFHRLTRPEGWE